MIILSKCLAGCKCRYDGNDNKVDWCIALKEKYEILEVCPEVLGGLPIPRIPSERLGDRVINRKGEDVTAAFCRGAKKALKAIESRKEIIAVLKSKSPSCGSGEIYDGSFTGTLKEGDGIFAELLKEKEIPVFSELQEKEVLKYLADKK
ncbi:DUF523 domain-containing protein [Acetivibrio sp. MSJd-27]|jgi:hypothetical protein|uniref:DUF523 domain-containing protein n=1 Tax=Acetivibrio sp. MSJd-27 TaxID=2841523 RepID=UPI0015AB1F36|nr:DUF523 domain-containing protein [Acetivibrio sp. MSJd-27]MBU5450356.1 DUF523 domain-containing protein [Acetivibrio sp. MSJd-27]